MGTGGMWATSALFAVLAVVPAVLNNWRPWEVVALVAALATAGAVNAGAWAWYAVRTREIELTTLSSDEQAAWLLGDSLGRWGGFLDEAASQEVWDAFGTASNESKRAFVLAVTGFLAETEPSATPGFSEKVLAIARSFRDPFAATPATASDEQVAHVFGDAVGRCGNFLDAVGTKELWAVFAAVPGGAKRELTNALTGFLSSADLDDGDGLDEKVLALARSFREHSGVARAPRAGAPAPHSLPVLIT